MSTMKAFVRGDNTLLPGEQRLREITLYIIFGGLTTLVNLISFYCIDILLHNMGLHASFGGISFDPVDVLNITVSWILAVLFAFVTNRIFVFRSKGPFFKELIGFFASRIATLILFEIGLFELGIFITENLMGLDKEDTALSIGHFSFKYKFIVKMLVAVFVVAGNYFLSKIYVFRGQKTNQPVASASDSISADGESEKNVGQ